MHFHTFTNFKPQKTLRQRSQYAYFIIYKHVTLFQLFCKISLHIFTSNHPKILPIPQPLFPPPPYLLSGQITLFHVTSTSSLPCKNSLTSPFSPRANHSLARFPLMGRIFSFGLSAPYLARSSSLPASIFRYWTGAACTEFYKRRGKYIRDEEKRAGGWMAGKVCKGAKSEASRRRWRWPRWGRQGETQSLRNPI